MSPFHTTPLLLHGGDCLKLLPGIPTGCVDMVFADLPYGTTQNKWDSVIPFEPLWKELNRVCKLNGAMVFTCAQPFTSNLILSNIENFKYEVIWEKTIGSGQLNISHQPLRVHENVAIFYRKKPTYNEQRTKGDPYAIKRKAAFDGPGYGKQTSSQKENTGYRHAKSIIKVPNPRIKSGHPTQKPISLVEYFIKTFTNEGDVVLDPCMGSGSTGVAALGLNRKFIGLEKDPSYFESASNWLHRVLETR